MIRFMTQGNDPECVQRSMCEFEGGPQNRLFQAKFLNKKQHEFRPKCCPRSSRSLAIAQRMRNVLAGHLNSPPFKYGTLKTFYRLGVLHGVATLVNYSVKASFQFDLSHFLIGQLIKNAEKYRKMIFTVNVSF